MTNLEYYTIVKPQIQQFNPAEQYQKQDRSTIQTIEQGNYVTNEFIIEQLVLWLLSEHKGND